MKTHEQGSTKKKLKLSLNIQLKCSLFKPSELTTEEKIK